MKHSNSGVPTKPLKASCSAVIATIALFASGLSVNAGLQIEKAYCGAAGSWRDVTAFLQQHIEGNAVSLTLSQPFVEIGGDPAWGQVKKLVIDYRMDGKSFRLLLEEQYPVAFDIAIPSSDAAAPEADADASAIMTEAQAGKNPNVAPLPVVPIGSRQQSWNRYGQLLTLCASVIAAICGCVALVQIRQIKNQLRKASNAP